MPSKRSQEKLSQTYAMALFEASKAEGRLYDNLQQIEALTRITPELSTVLEQMYAHGHTDLLKSVFDAYKERLDSDTDVVGVEVTTAVPLTDDARETITKKCEQDFGTSVFLIENVDPSILGGIILSARGQRRDVSVATQLRSIREKLSDPLNLDGGVVSDS